MTTQLLTDHIQNIRRRLADLQGERASVARDDFSRKADLIDEERTLESLLAELRERAMQDHSPHA